MVEQLNESTEQFSAQDYENEGGRWDKKTFVRLTEIVKKRETNPIKVKRTDIDRAHGMATYTGLEFIPEEAYLYAVLCQDPIEKTLSQQQLMAEVILVMGNPQKRKDFMSVFPNVDFNNSAAQREAARQQQEKVRPILYSNEIMIFSFGR